MKEDTKNEIMGRFISYTFHQAKNKLTIIDRAIYLDLIYSLLAITKEPEDFYNGIQISIRQLVEEVNISKPTVVKALKNLQDNGLIKRTKRNNVGPKQAYRYSIVIPEGIPLNTILNR